MSKEYKERSHKTEIILWDGSNTEEVKIFIGNTHYSLDSENNVFYLKDVFNIDTPASIGDYLVKDATTLYGD